MAVLVMSGLVTAGGASGATDFDDNQVPIGNHADPGSLHLLSDDSLEDENVDPPSMLTIDQSFVSGQPFCSGPTDPNCAGKSMWFVAHLPVCTAASETDCIDSVSANTSSGASASGTFDRYFPNMGPRSYTGDPSIALPTGRAPSVWKIPGAPHAEGDLYMVVANLRGSTKRRAAATFRLVLTPISYKPDADPRPEYKMTDWTEPGRLAGPAADRGQFRCAYWGESGSCMLSHAFPANTRFTVKVRLHTEPAGWLHGRVNEPAIAFTKNGSNTDVTVTAAPIQVPAFQIAQQHAAYSATLQQAFGPSGRFGEGGSRRPGGQYLTDLSQRNAEYNFRSYKDEGFEQFALVKDLIEDKASYAPWIWRVRTLEDGEMSKAGKCLTDGDGVKGIVTTNATIYGSGPPAYNSTTKTIDYKVAAPHYTRTGEVFKGAYHLHMRSDVARCFYGFTDAPVSGTVSVIEEDGNPGTAVTNISEAAGWLKVAATGFTHSAPTVKVALTQKAAAATAKVKRTRTITAKSLAKAAKLRVPRGAKLSVSVSKKHAKICRASKTSVRGLKKGKCTATVTVTSKGKKSRKTVTITVS
ncbi:MAG: hypothetical protein ACO3RB_06520 [Ilumatobacteraceae bacterium]